MTLHMYAMRKKLNLQSSTVRVKHAKIHAQDCETTNGKIDEFQRKLTVKGDLDTEQRQRLLEIAHVCPIHRTAAQRSQGQEDPRGLMWPVFN